MSPAALTQEPAAPTPPVPSPTTEPIYRPGLEGVAFAQTRLSRVDGEQGRLTVAGFAVEELAPHATFEEVIHLLWHGNLPTFSELDELRDALSRFRSVPEPTLGLLRLAASAGLPAMDALRLAADSLALDAASRDQDGVAWALVARLPLAMAAYRRLRRGLEPIAESPGLGLAASCLYALDGEEPAAARVRALDTYWATVCDHGANASTFACRVVTSTGSTLVPALVAAIGALQGPLHGGAPGPALDMVHEIGSAENAEPFLRRQLERGERLMGFGHRVYKVRDPRAQVLGDAARELYADHPDRDLYELTRHVEDVAVRLLDEYKPGRRLRANVELYTALLLHGLGIETDDFTPLFACGRAAGWIAHAREQRAEGRLLRPRLRYVGGEDRVWVPITDRQAVGSAP